MLGKIFKRESKRERLLQRLENVRKADEFEVKRKLRFPIREAEQLAGYIEFASNYRALVYETLTRSTMKAIRGCFQDKPEYKAMNKHELILAIANTFELFGGKKLC